jgi:hypothetical protein
VLKIIENTKIDVDLKDEKIEIKINKYLDGRYTHGQIDSSSFKNKGI